MKGKRSLISARRAARTLLRNYSLGVVAAGPGAMASTKNVGISFSRPAGTESSAEMDRDLLVVCQKHIFGFGAPV